MGSSGSKSGGGGATAGWQPSQPGAARKVSQSGYDITPLTVEERIEAAAPLTDFQRHVTLQARRARGARRASGLGPGLCLQHAKRGACPLTPCLARGMPSQPPARPNSLLPCWVCRPALSAPSLARRWTALPTTTSARGCTCRPWAASPSSARVRAPPRELQGVSAWCGHPAGCSGCYSAELLCCNGIAARQRAPNSAHGGRALSARPFANPSHVLPVN